MTAKGDVFDERDDFASTAMSKAEAKFGGSFDRDENDQCLNKLYTDWIAAGRPNTGKWLDETLPTVFKCVNKHPEWYGAVPEWPIRHGKPFSFVSQIDVKDSKSDILSNATLYIFVTRVPEGKYWRAEYHVEEIPFDLRRVRILASKDGTARGLKKVRRKRE